MRLVLICMWGFGHERRSCCWMEMGKVQELLWILGWSVLHSQVLHWVETEPEQAGLTQPKTEPDPT